MIRERTVYAYKISEAHGELWEDEILEIVSNARVIVGTNLLESSVTIENLKVVIDTLLKNEVASDVIREVMVSKAEADQRAGRVGRTSTGRIHRLIPDTKEYLTVRGLGPTSSPEDIFRLVDEALLHVLGDRKKVINFW